MSVHGVPRMGTLAAIGVTLAAIAGAAGFLVVHHDRASGPALVTAGATATTLPAVPPPVTTPPVTTPPVTSAPLTTPPAPPTTTVGSPHFGTPQAAMSYLAAAWNTGNTVDLDYVSNPAGRAALQAMHDEAVDLSLDHCSERPEGDYLCYFDHGYLPSTPAAWRSSPPRPMVVLVGPAEAPGWYLTVFESCG
jgi:hypothetical protein